MKKPLKEMLKKIGGGHLLNEKDNASTFLKKVKNDPFHQWIAGSGKLSKFKDEIHELVDSITELTGKYSDDVAVTKKFLENLLMELKDLINENYQNYRVMHMHIISYLFDKNYFSEFNDSINCKNLSIETQFISVPNNLIFEINKTLEHFHIKTAGYLNQNYIQSLFKEQKIGLSEMAYKSQLGYNTNEVSIIPKNVKKAGFFEKFFQLFS